MGIIKKTIGIHYEIIDTRESLNGLDRELIAKAGEQADLAYAPYSLFRVGAAVLLSNNTIITGANQENAAYPSGLCAERVAVFYAMSAHPEERIVKIAVLAKNEAGNYMPVSPCGSCRQVLIEYEAKQKSPVEVLLVQGDNNILRIRDISSLLPLGFDNLSFPE